MKDDEIKEILDKLRETADYPKLNYSSYDKSYNETIDNVAMIKSFSCKQLLDYITNLQQRIEKAVEYIELYTETTKVDNVRFPFELKELNLSTACRERLLNILNGKE